MVCVCDSQNPELVARLAKIRARQEQKEYDQMVKNIDPRVSEVLILQCAALCPSHSHRPFLIAYSEGYHPSLKAVWPEQ